jgi:hypothetical protein
METIFERAGDIPITGNHPKRLHTTSNIVHTMRKPFDVLAEGLHLSKSRGDSTPIELFLEGVRAWHPATRALLVGKPR